MAQTASTPKLTAKTVKLHVHSLGACVNGEIGFDSANKLRQCDAGVWKTIATSGDLLASNNTWTGTNTFQNTVRVDNTSLEVEVDGTLAIDGLFDLPDKTSNPTALAGRFYHNANTNRVRSSDGIIWFEYATVSAAQTFSGLQTFTGGLDASGANAGVRHRKYSQCARPSLGDGETVFWFRNSSPTCTGTGNGHGGLLHYDGANYWWFHGASGGGAVVADVCNGTSCDS